MILILAMNISSLKAYTMRDVLIQSKPFIFGGALGFGAVYAYHTVKKYFRYRSDPRLETLQEKKEREKKEADKVNAEKIASIASQIVPTASPTASSPSCVGPVVGIENCGASCYMNSVLQCLVRIKNLTNFLVSPEIAGGYQENCLARCLCNFLNLYKQQAEKIQRISAADVINTIYGCADVQLAERVARVSSGEQGWCDAFFSWLPWFKKSKDPKPMPSNKIIERWQQHDAQEFLNLLLERLEGDGKCHACGQAIKAELRDLFFTTYTTTDVCRKCGTKNVTGNIQLGIFLLPCQGDALSLEGCFKSWHAPEEIADYNCEQCKKNSELSSAKPMATRVISIDRGSEILTIAFNRFSDPDKKISTPIRFPLADLDLSACGIKGAYDLVGVVSHSGGTKCGHNISFVKAEDNWFLCNDSAVSRISSIKDYSENHSNVSDLSTFTPYILFYQRKKVDRHQLPID